MGGKSMAKYMEPTGLGNPGPVLGSLENEVRRFPGERLGAVSAGKEPGIRAIDPPIGPQILQEAWRQQGFAIFLALALCHPHAHPMAIDMGDLEMDDFTRP